MGYLTEANIGGSDYKLAGALYGTCTTAAGTAAKAVTCSDFDALETGVTIHVKFTNSNTASNATMNVNSTGAKNLCRYGTTRVGTTADTSWTAGAVVSFTYDGTSWVMNDYVANTDTKETTGSTNSTQRLFLVGAIDQEAWGQTNSNSNLYATNGALVCSTISTNGGTNNYELGAACEKAIGSVADGNTGLVTGDAVYDAIQAVQAGAMTYVGGVASLTDASHPLLNNAVSKGEVYVVTTSFTISDGTVTHTLEVGDLIIINTSGTYTTQASLYAVIDIVQQNLDVLTTSDIDAAIAEAEAAA